MGANDIKTNNRITQEEIDEVITKVTKKYVKDGPIKKADTVSHIKLMSDRFDVIISYIFEIKKKFIDMVAIGDIEVDDINIQWVRDKIYEALNELENVSDYYDNAFYNSFVADCLLNTKSKIGNNDESN